MTPSIHICLKWNHLSEIKNHYWNITVYLRTRICINKVIELFTSNSPSVTRNINYHRNQFENQKLILKSEINVHVDIRKQPTNHCDFKWCIYNFEARPFHFVLGLSSAQIQIKKVWLCGTKAVILYVHDIEHY